MKRLTLPAFFILFLAGVSACTGLTDLYNVNPTVELTVPSETSIAPAIDQPVVIATETQPQPEDELSLTITPDLCSAENIGVETEKVHRLMREFDDASSLASNTPSQQLYAPIAEMQRIRREAEDLKVPACLERLRLLQLNHMETVINTMLAFYAGSNSEVVNAGILQARQEYELYMLELANLLGLTPVAASTQLAGETDPLKATPEWTKVLTVVLKPDFNAANMREIPAKDGTVVEYLYPGQQAGAFAQSEDGEWFLLSIPSQPDKKAWVASSVLDILEGDANALPVYSLTP